MIIIIKHNWVQQCTKNNKKNPSQVIQNLLIDIIEKVLQFFFFQINNTPTTTGLRKYSHVLLFTFQNNHKKWNNWIKQKNCSSKKILRGYLSRILNQLTFIEFCKKKNRMFLCYGCEYCKFVSVHAWWMVRVVV